MAHRPGHILSLSAGTALILGATLATSGCAHRQRGYESSNYRTVTYVQGQTRTPTPAGVAPVASQVPYQDVQVVQQQHQVVHGVPQSLGQEALSSGERVTVVTYVHRYPDPVDSYPSVFWSGRWYYNVQGSFVFWDPFWACWAYYWGPPQSLIMAWNFQYPWVPFAFASGFYGPGWYWGGVNAMGRHQLGLAPPANIAPAPLPPAPRPPTPPAPKVASVAPRHNPSRPGIRPSTSVQPRENRRVASSTVQPRPASGAGAKGRVPSSTVPPRPASGSRATAHRRVAHAGVHSSIPDSRRRPNHAGVAARPNRAVASTARRPNRSTKMYRPNTPSSTAVPRPANVRAAHHRPSYVQQNHNVGARPNRTGTVRVYRPQPSRASARYPGASSSGGSPPSFRPSPTRSAAPRPSPSFRPSPSRSVAPRPASPPSRGTSRTSTRGHRPR